MQVSALWSGLNDAQRLAALHGDATGAGVLATPLLVIAGAGTGKTNTLAHRVAHLLLNGVAPERMLLLTFTRRAALEMTRRAQRVIAEALAQTVRQRPRTREPCGCRGPAPSTRSATGCCAATPPRLGLDPTFSVLDRGDAADLIDVVRQRLGSRPDRRNASRARTRASRSIRTA